MNLKKCLLLVGVVLTTTALLTGCGKKEEKVKQYEKEIEQSLNNAISQVENEVNTASTNQTAEGESNAANEQRNVSTSLKKDSSKEIVYDLVNDAKEWSYTSTYNGREMEIKESYSFRIPQLNINSSDADNINQKIQEGYVKTYKNTMDVVNNYGHAGGCSKIEYAYHLNGDVISIVMASYWDGGSTERTAYNINVKTGKEVTNAELLKQKGISESEFPGKLSNILKEALKDWYTPPSEMNSTDTIEFYNTQYKRTTAIENCSAENDMYLNANGELCIIVTRYNLAGGESTKIIVNEDTAKIYVMD